MSENPTPKENKSKKRKKSQKGEEPKAKKPKRIKKDTKDTKEDATAAKEEPTQSETKEETTTTTSTAPNNDQRFILFVGRSYTQIHLLTHEGNLPFDLTKEEIQKHFACIEEKGKGKILDIRMLTKKGTGQFKGCAFIEFNNAKAQRTALKLHHSMVKGRKINVEVTVGGGGSSQKRKEKLKEKNERVKKQRKKHFKSKVQQKKLQKKEQSANTNNTANSTEQKTPAPAEDFIPV